MITVLSLDEYPHHHEVVFQLLSRIYVEGFSAPPWNEDWQIEDAYQEIANATKSCRCLLAFVDQQVAGFGLACPLQVYAGAVDLQELGLSSSAYYIRELVTASGFRCRGVCTTICRAFESFAISEGHSELVLRTRTDNCALFGVTQRVGMVRAGEYAAETGGRKSPRVIFTKSLLEVSAQ